MKILSRIFICIYTMLLLSALILPSSLFAKTIDLYDQPESDAKKVGTIDISTGVMHIFKPKDSDWVKVADPSNGNVGWVKSTELTNGAATTFSFTQKVFDGDKGGQNYQVYEFGNTSTVAPEQTQQLINQKAVQQYIQKVVNEINTVYQQQINSMKESNFPIIMPIVIFPQQQKHTLPASTEVSKTPAKVNSNK